MNLPRILIFDDFYGHNEVLRALFCEQLRLWDMDGGAPPPEDEYLAQVRFCSGQRVVPEGEYERVSNDMNYVIDTIRAGWPFKEDGGRWSLILIDYQFPTGRRRNGTPLLSSQQPGDSEFGEAIVRKIVETWPFTKLFDNEVETHLSDIPFAMFSRCAPDKVEPRVDPQGNRAYMWRPEEMTDDEGIRLRRQLAKLLFKYGLVEDGALRRVKSDGTLKLIRGQKMVGKSLAFLRTLRKARAVTTSTGKNLVLIQGDIGTGKEPLANYMHDHSRPAGAPFIRCDLTTLGSGVIEGVIFGYGKGVFTGQNQLGKQSLFEKAKNGGLFLDEIGNYPPLVLKKLLRATGVGTFSRMGEEEIERDVKCQIICATNKTISELVHDQGFPIDLLSRFNAIGISLPPLVIRKGDKRLLLDHFLNEEISKLEEQHPKTPSPEVYAWIEEFPWPFNIRQMKIAAETAVRLREESGTIQLDDLKAVLDTSGQLGQRAALTGFGSLINALKSFEFQPGEEAKAVGAMPRFQEAAGSVISRMIEAAAKLPGNSNGDGSPNFTGCLRTIHGFEILKTDVAKKYFYSLQKNFVLDNESEVVGGFLKEFSRPEGRRGGVQ
jgi:DNA-binding NtrC family response regulator